VHPPVGTDEVLVEVLLVEVEVVVVLVVVDVDVVDLLVLVDDDEPGPFGTLVPV
jgi:hypothetical protein